MEHEVWRRRVVALGGEPDAEATAPTLPTPVTTTADLPATAPTLLAATTWNPGSMQDRTASGTLAALAPATELDVAFTVPASGSVLVRMSGLAAGVTDEAAEAWAVHEVT